MIWMDYNIQQAGSNFKVEGDWPGEVMGLMRDGSKKETCLYKPGDVFIVNQNGWLVKTDEVNALLKKYESSKEVVNGY
jgi:hypothetical protein|tara:strand:- start:702 stop:935 length:234 start_codon:yes stop_codon:yes gene_type:complete